MADITESAEWEEGIYQIDINDPVVGGEDGIDNRPHKELANRTLYLKQLIDLISGDYLVAADLAAHVAALDAHPQYLLNANGFDNLIINPDFSINQRVFAGGALGAGVYGYDRFKAGAAGASISVAGGVVTLASGSIVQVIESPDLASESITVSVDTPTEDISIDAEGNTGVIPAGAGRQSVTVTLGAGDNGDIAIELSKDGAAGSVSFSNLKVERGSKMMPYTKRPQLIEKILCQRYYCKTFAESVAPTDFTSYVGCLRCSGYIGGASTFEPCVSWRFPVSMRDIPVVTLYNPNSTPGNVAGEWGTNYGSPSPAGARPVHTSREGTNIDNNAVAGNVTAEHDIHATAEAEL